MAPLSLILSRYYSHKLTIVSWLMRVSVFCSIKTIKLWMLNIMPSKLQVPKHNPYDEKYNSIRFNLTVQWFFYVHKGYDDLDCSPVAETCSWVCYSLQAKSNWSLNILKALLWALTEICLVHKGEIQLYIRNLFLKRTTIPRIFTIYRVKYCSSNRRNVIVHWQPRQKVHSRPFLTWEELPWL